MQTELNLFQFLYGTIMIIRHTMPDGLDVHFNSSMVRL